MKFSTYTPAVEPHVMNPPVVRVSGDVNAYGTSGEGYGKMAAAVGQVARVAAQRQDDLDAADVMKARNEVMTSLTQQLYGEQGLFTTGVGENAKGLIGRTTDAINKTYEDVSKNYNPRVRHALKGNLNENMANFQRIAASKEMAEGKKVEEATFASNLQTNAQQAALTWQVNGAPTMYVNQSDILLAAQAQKEGWSGAQFAAERRKMVTNIAAAAAGAALENEDYDRADEILGRFRNEMDPDTYWKLARVSKKHTEAKEFDSLAHEIFSKPGVWEGNHFNEAKALEYVNELYGPNVTKRIGGAIKNKEDFFAAVAGQESGGNYNAQNGRTGAFGKYQIMPENWPSWAQEAGLSADAPQTPENQEIVAKYKLGQYYDELGAEGALVAWYAGYRNGERWRDGEADAIGEGGHYSWDARQGNGDEPSIREYVQQALGRAGGAERTVSAYDPEKRDHLMKLVSALGKDAEQAYQQQRGQYLDGIMRAAQSAGSYSAAISMLYAQDLDMKERNTLEGQIAEYYHVNRSTGRAIGSGRSGTNNGKSWSKAYPEEAKALNRFAEHLRKGTTITKAELLEARRAGNLYADLGYLSEEDAADLELYENSSEMRSQVTDFIERRGLGGAFEEMLDMGGTPTANIIILSKALPYYLDDNFQGIIDEEG
nr:MAG TPA: hypothetical protein [Caudoviricetes sp.]